MEALVLWRVGRKFEELISWRKHEFLAASEAERAGRIELHGKCSGNASRVWFENNESIKRFTNRCVLVVAVIEDIVSSDRTVETCVDRSWSCNDVRVHARGSKRMASMKRKWMDVAHPQFDKNAATLWLVELEGMETEPCLKKYVVGRELARGGAKHAIRSLKRRAFCGPTSMKPELAVLTANLARVRYMDVVMDPCAGTGSLLQAAASLTGNRVVCLAADVDESMLLCTWRNFQIANLWDPVILRASLMGWTWMRDDVRADVMMCDLPYGERAEIMTQNCDPIRDSETNQNQFMLLFWNAVNLASKTLQMGGKFACWIPTTAAPSITACFKNGSLQQTIGIHLDTIIHENRRGGIQRSLLILHRSQIQSEVAEPKASLQDLEMRQTDRRCHQHDPVVTSPSQTGAEELSVMFDVWKAAWTGNVNKVQGYLTAGGKVDAVDPNSGCTMLQLAAGYCRLSVCDLLLDFGVDVLPAGGHSGGALHRAARHGHIAILQMLLERKGRLALEAAEHLDATGSTALRYAARYGHANCADLLLGHLNKSEKTRIIDLAAHDGLTPLCAASRYGKIDAVQILLKHGADPLAQSCCDERLSCAHVAARWDHVKVLQLLQTSNPSSLWLLDARGQTALDEARAWKRTRCIQFLEHIEK